MRLGTTPSVSVVVASTLDLAALEAWLVDVERQCRLNNVQLVVMRSSDDGLPELFEMFPAVVFASADASLGSSVLRSVGVSLATGDIVAITGDSHSLSPDWVAAITRRRSGISEPNAETIPAQ